VPGSNLYQCTDYSDWGFPWYSPVPSCEFRDQVLVCLATGP
jgi:hypothetical protein